MVPVGPIPQALSSPCLYHRSRAGMIAQAVTASLGKLRCVNVQILRCLHIRCLSISDRAHSLKLELARKLPPLH
jgi:hypothetical protein